MKTSFRVTISCGWLDGNHPCFHPLAAAGIHYEPAKWPEFYEHAKDFDCIQAGGEVYDKKVLDQLPRLKLIQRHGAGYDAIDLDYAAKLGIAVANTPGANAPAVAEFTLMLALAANQRLREVTLPVADWSAFPMGRALEGTVGLVGFGHIARAFAKLLAVFPVKIIACDPCVSAAEMAGLGVEKCTLADIRLRADTISVHAQATPATRHIISRDFLENLGRPVVLVNTSRGSLIDEPALIDALKSGRVLAAGLDVQDDDTPHPADHPLFQLPNCVATPHIATNNLRCRVAVNTMAVQNIINFANGKPIAGLLNPDYINFQRSTRNVQRSSAS